MKIISVNNISKSFDTVTALNDVTLSIEEGSFYGLLGENGAGKTTLINILTGQLKPTTGSVKVYDLDPSEQPVEVKKQLGVLPEKETPLSFLTPREFFHFVGDVRELSEQTVEEKITYFSKKFDIVDKLDELNKDLSRGQQQKVMFISTVIHEPELLIIDEPLANLDPHMQNVLKNYLKEYNKKGNTIVLSSHYLEAAFELVDTIGIMHNGALLKETKVEDTDIEQIKNSFINRGVENDES